MIATEINSLVGMHMNCPHFSPLHCIQVSSLFEPPCQSQQLTNWYIQWWNEDFFECTNLKALGLRVQLGHLDGSACILIVPAFNDDFVVLDNHSIHDLDFCRCGHAQSHIMQLLHYGWYPAMVGQSKTATTFQVLKQFHLLIFESKTSVYEFYCSLAHKTNNMATYLVKNHYITFLRMVRQWRHISILKRMGWGHDPLGVSATSQGKYSHLPCLSSTRREPPHQLEDHTQRTKVSLHYPS